MSLDPTATSSWQKLAVEATSQSSNDLTSLFEADVNRAETFTRQANGLTVDFSKQLINKQILDLLIELAKETGLTDRIQAMFDGEAINVTEDRAVGHVWLRSSNPKPEVETVNARIRDLADAIANGSKTGHTNKPYSAVVNIGIGGSDLGPQMAYLALRKVSDLPTGHYVSNVDPADLLSVLEECNPEETLFVVSSKSFKTPETLQNASLAKSWIVEALGEDATYDHFVAVTTNDEAAVEFGVPADNIYGFWDWVGGRYSVSSAIGISLSITLGNSGFAEFLAGMEEMDTHFRETELAKNLPAVMSLIDIWNTNFQNFPARAVIPYSHRLSRFPAFLQQLEMESNGKATRTDGSPVTYQTCPIVWGEPGTNGQHAFFQLLHQGTVICPIDFIGFAECECATTKLSDQLAKDTQDSHLVLLSNLFAQSAALAFGKSNDDPHREFKGNRPSTTIIAERLDPRTLGSLIALYEHKTMATGTILGINSFDQFGVELGKVMSNNMLPTLQSDEEPNFDSSSNQLIKLVKSLG